jgi:hypothetical protein
MKKLVMYGGIFGGLVVIGVVALVTVPMLYNNWLLGRFLDRSVAWCALASAMDTFAVYDNRRFCRQ